MAQSSKRPLAVLDLKKVQKIGSFILKGNEIILNIGNHPEFFPTPSPTLVSVQDAFNKLQEGELVAQTRVVGAVAQRNIFYTEALNALRALQAYVQLQADSAADEQTAIAIILASGFSLKVNGVRVKPPLEAKNGKVSGYVDLIGKSAGSRASYNWQKSLDAGNSWQDLPPTLAAKTSVNSFVPGTQVHFRMRPVVKSGPQNWTEPVGIIVV